MSQRGDTAARALEVCLQGIQADLGPEQAMEASPHWADELRPLVWTALSARSHAAAIQIPEIPQENSLVSFLQIAQRIKPRAERPLLKQTIHTLVVLMLVALTLIILLAGSAWTAERIARPALPGSLLYPVKLTSEQVRLSLAKDAAQFLALEMASDQERLTETHTLIQRSLTAEVTLVGNLIEKQNAQWLVEDIRIQIPPNARIMGDIQPGYAIAVQGTLQADGSVLAHSLRMREYTLTGVIQSITMDQLQLDNITIQLIPQTLIIGIPVPGSQAQVILRHAQNGQLHARLIEILP